MKVKLKDGRVLPIEEGSYIALDDHGETLEVKAKEIRFVKGRLKFGDSKNSAPFPSMVVIF